MGHRQIGDIGTLVLVDPDRHRDVLHPYHPMTQGKIERWHRSLKNQVLLENYYLPGDLKARIGEFVDYYNTARYHESLNNLTPEDVYTGRGQTLLNHRRRIKQKTLEQRRRLYDQQKAA